MNIDFKKYPWEKRLRHHTGANLYFPLSELKEIPNYYPPLIKEINWKDYFANGLAPDILDVGCGKGKLLLEYALNHSDINILGIEVRKQAVDWLNGVIKGEQIPNCSALWYSVINMIPFVESESIKAIYYLFPDPWTKRKQIKRRAFTAEMLAEYERVMKQGAKLFLATDLPEVHEYHLSVVKSNNKFKFSIVENDEEWGLPITNKERFCRAENIPFFRIIAEKL